MRKASHFKSHMKSITGKEQCELLHFIWPYRDVRTGGEGGREPLNVQLGGPLPPPKKNRSRSTIELESFGQT